MTSLDEASGCLTDQTVPVTAFKCQKQLEMKITCGIFWEVFTNCCHFSEYFPCSLTGLISLVWEGSIE